MEIFPGRTSFPGVGGASTHAESADAVRELSAVVQPEEKWVAVMTLTDILLDSPASCDYLYSLNYY